MKRLTIYLPDSITLTLDLTEKEIESFENKVYIDLPHVVLFEGKTKHVVITENILMYTVGGEE